MPPAGERGQRLSPAAAARQPPHEPAPKRVVYFCGRGGGVGSALVSRWCRVAGEPRTSPPCTPAQSRAPKLLQLQHGRWCQCMLECPAQTYQLLLGAQLQSGPGRWGGASRREAGGGVRQGGRRTTLAARQASHSTAFPPRCQHAYAWRAQGHAATLPAAASMLLPYLRGVAALQQRRGGRRK